MSLTAGLCAAAKRDFMLGVHQASDLYKLALYDEAATLSPLTDTYTTAGEVTGQGYPKGGVALTGYTVKLDGLKALLGFSRDVIVANATIAAVGGLVYNSSKGNAPIGVIAFGQKITSTNGNFKVMMSDLFWIA